MKTLRIFYLFTHKSTPNSISCFSKLFTFDFNLLINNCFSEFVNSISIKANFTGLKLKLILISKFSTFVNSNIFSYINLKFSII